MKTMKIYEPAMCCPTGLCGVGVGVDPELLRISTVLNTLKQNGVEVQRFNLTSAPAEFLKSKAVTEYMQNKKMVFLNYLDNRTDLLSIVPAA